MQKHVFPTELLHEIRDQPALINLHHISHFIELSQLAPKNLSDTLWLHTDPVSMKDGDVKEKVS